MRRLAVITMGLFLINAGQLRAQATDDLPPARDPFAPAANAANEAAPPRGKPNARPRDLVADQPRKQVTSQPDDLFPSVLVATGSSAAHRRIEAALNNEATFDYLDQPLRDVVEDISFEHKIPILIDTKALEEFGIDAGTPITKSLKGIRLRSALRLMLRELQLTYVIRDEVLQVTTPEVAASALSTRFYCVAELLPPNGDGQVLVELIKTFVAPNTWCGLDGVRSVVYVEHLESLAVRQTEEVFHEIEVLLATTKRLAEKHEKQRRRRAEKQQPRQG